MTVDLVAFRSVKRNVECDLRKRFADELILMPEAERQAYLADASATYALAFVRLAWPEGDKEPDR